LPRKSAELTEASVAASLPHLFCDIDGVLAFQPEGSMLAVNARFGTSYLVPEATSYPWVATLPDRQQRWARANRAVIAANLAPDTLAVHVLQRAVSEGLSVTVCTERDESLTALTRAWCAYWGVPGADEVQVVGPGGKAGILEPCGPDDPAVLIDDAPRNEDLARPGVRVWVPPRPWTPQGDAPAGVWRFPDWHAVKVKLGLVK
jgi:hypothetical protein